MNKLLDREVSVSMDVLLMFTCVVIVDFVSATNGPHWLVKSFTFVFMVLFVRSWIILFKHFFIEKSK